jgi:hypothetical protein
MGEMRNAYEILVRERDRSENIGVDGDNIKMDLREIVWECVEWIHLAHDGGQW